MSIQNTSKTPRPDWLFGKNPDAIEAQEKHGQNQLVTSSQLPRQVNSPRGADAKTKYENLGIKVIGESSEDDLFFDVTLPKNLELRPTDHSMWNELFDNSQNKVIATIFYKAAWYDRSAFINFDD